MSCHESAKLVADYFDESVKRRTRQAIETHMQACGTCRAAVAEAQLVNAQLRQWQDEAVPQWQRVPRELRSRPEERKLRVSFWAQWAPLAAACVLALAFVFNVQLQVNDNGFSVAFGAQRGVDAEQLAARLVQFEQEQRAQQAQALQALNASIEQRQADSNAQLLQTVITQFGDSTTRSLQQVMVYFEAQRQEDLALMQASYQRLVDSDYQTVRSMQQLANYVQYQGGQVR